jgi:uncharacterized protein YjbI with pentapeptide repeats
MKQANSRKNIFRIEWLAYTLWSSAIVLGIAGFLVKTFCASKTWTGLVSDFYPNVITDLLSIGFGIMVIDRLYQQRNDERDRRMLISQMASPFNILACDAARILKDRGWHSKLDGISLWKANLEGAELNEFTLVDVNLTYANLKNANLCGAILNGAKFVLGDDGSLEGTLLDGTSLKQAQMVSEKNDRPIFKNARLVGTDLSGATLLGIFDGIMTESIHPHLQAAYCMRDSIMPNGKRYDGRYNLQGDLVVASYNRDTNDPLVMAEFYGVTLEEYQQGQDWSIQYDKYWRTLERKARSLCAKKGLDWDRMNENLRGKFVDTFLREP